MKQFRQGDILITEVNTIPSKEKRDEKKGRMLVAGEHSNHGHFAVGEVEIIDEDDKMFLEVHGDAMVKHLLIDSGVWTKEHYPIQLEKGKKYIVERQYEYDPYEKAVRYVQD
jgi:hypothetical protein